MQWAKSDTVPEWHDFSAFVRDVGVRPPGTKLVRIDRSAPIGPGNFKWRENAPTNGARLARYRDGSKTFSGAQRDATLRRRFGITALEYDAMLASQGGRCAICDAAQADARKHPKTGKPIAFHVDHDHQAGEVRALLCGKCNVMLGSATESPRVLRRAAAYLETHRMRSVA